MYGLRSPKWSRSRDVPDVGEQKGKNMSEGIVEETARPRRILQSVGALLAGFVVNVALSLATDAGLHAIGVLPAVGVPMSDQQSLLAAAYRTLFGVFTSYLVARLAPHHPLGHALLGGALGLVICIAGAVATWNQGLGPHWYPLALAVLALPTAWAGGKIFELQKR